MRWLVSEIEPPGEGQLGPMSRLRIGFDGWWWADGPPSGRHVVRSLVLEWIRVFPDDEVRLRVPSRDFGRVRDELKRSRVHVTAATRWCDRLPHAVSLALSRWAGLDVAVLQNFGSPFAHCKTAAFVHDALPPEHPHWFTRGERLYMRLLPISNKRTSLIFTSSSNEAARIRRAWPRLPAPSPVGLRVPVDLAEAVLSRPSSLTLAVGRPYVLAVGRLNVRKNLATLIEAFDRSHLLSSKVDLVIVGERQGKSVGLTEGSHVQYLGGVSNNELAWLYQHAAIFAFPSLDEGFGLPLLEAAFYGAPIVASDIPVFRELNMADHYVDPLDVNSWIDALERVLSVPDSDTQPAADLADWTTVVRAMRNELVGGST